MNERRVAVICQLLWGDAAVERRARTEISTLLNFGFAVSMLTQQPTTARALELWPAIVGAQPTVEEAPRLFASHTSTKMLSFGLAAARFARRRLDCDTLAVIGHSPAALVGGLPFARRHGVRSIYVCHTSPPPPPEAALPGRHRVPTAAATSLLEGLALRYSDLVVCPSPRSTDFYSRKRSGPTITLENPIDSDAFTPDPKRRKEIDVLFVGRLAPEKGAAVLLQALARVRRPLRTAIVGTGVEKSRLEELAARCPGEVQFRGFVANAELVDWFRRARVVAVPSFTEAAGMVPVEAMATGTPVVASAVGGLLDTVEDGVNGWLFPAGDVDALASMLADVLADEPRRAAAGVAAVEAARRFNVSTFSERLLDAYSLVGS